LQGKPAKTIPMTDPTTLPTSSRTDRFTVLVADDHPIVAQVIAQACADRPALEVLGFVTTGTEALEHCRRWRPDVLVLDLGMPGIDGFQIVRQLNEEGRTTKVLVVSGFASAEVLLQCMRLGVEGMREKTGRVEEIAAAVEDVARGAQAYTEEQQGSVRPLLANLTRRSREAARVASALTKRERAILELMVRGYSNKQCARALGITERTVESHLFGLYSKLHATSRIVAVQRAIELGLVDLTQPEPTPAAAAT
jgi:two-component system nitrate/nitrite response regulator NarL